MKTITTKFSFTALHFLSMFGARLITELRLPCFKKTPKMRGFGKRPFSLSMKIPAPYVLPGPIDEELLPNGRLKYFHPTQPGQILGDRFKTIAKLGFGSGSTVWLAENIA